MPAPAGGSFRVRFDEQAFAEDLEHASRAGRSVAETARLRMSRDGIAPSELRRCEAEGRDGTRLPRCVKTYLPPPTGQWGMVFTAAMSSEDELELICIAFGERHPIGAWRPSVYKVSHRRLDGDQG